MAIGLHPSYSTAFAISSLTKEQFLALAHDTAVLMTWKIVSRNADGFTAITTYRQTKANEQVEVIVEDQVVNIKSRSIAPEILDWGRNKNNVEGFQFRIGEAMLHYTAEALDLRAQELSQEEPPTDEATYDEPDSPLAKENTGFFSLFVPKKGFFITPLIIDLNLLIFLVMAFSGVSLLAPDALTLLHWGANLRPYTVSGQLWRLLTNIFLHIGILHLLFNMYALLYVGVLLEPRLGSVRFAIAYFVTGFIASVASIYWHPMTVSAGASGAIFGMYGVFLAMLTTNLIEKTIRTTLLSSIAVFVAYNLLNGLKGNIDSAAHIGGLLSGMIVGYSFYPSLSSTVNDRWKLVVPVTTIALLFLAGDIVCGNLARKTKMEYQNMDLVSGNQDPGQPGNAGNRNSNRLTREDYVAQMKLFFSRESQAMEALKMPANTPKEKLLDELKERSLYYWQADRDLIVDLDKHDLPPQLHVRNKILLRYCDLRIEQNAVLQKAVQEGVPAYQDQLKEYANRIDSLIDQLSQTAKPSPDK
ncbi:MAG TPA: rhomboid family intramembrane serine protease [Puia sp.]|nr:rhomboid family intramembrane serine protease [Puia sp.]